MSGSKQTKTVSSDRYIEAPQFIINKIVKNGSITTHNPNSLTAAFKKILKRNNINSFRFHDFIMQRDGWKSDKVLKAVYRHALSDRQKEMNDKANDYFSKVYDTKK